MFTAQVNALIADITHKFSIAEIVRASSWQSTKAPQPMAEVLNYSFTLDLEGVNLDLYQKALVPNLPWADSHFEKERVSGDPINPGDTWRIWPYSQSADTHRKGKEENPSFSHSYAERYWPKFANTNVGGKFEEAPDPKSMNWGYRFPYGDLEDLIQILLEDSLTRQAYLPIWFPEDLSAARMKERVPCSLGYHFIRRNDQLHIFYPMRSCDCIRHFRDDVYLTIRLLIWVLQQCQLADPTNWMHVIPGTFTMHITSLHMFESDQATLIKRLLK